MPERYLTLSEAAEYLQLHPESLRRKARRHEVPAVKLGIEWRFKAATLDVWLAEGCPNQREQPSLFDGATPGD